MFVLFSKPGKSILGKDDRCDSPLAIYLSYLSVLSANLKLIIKTSIDLIFY